MAKKGGIGKRGVGGKTNTKKTNKAALRAGFEVRHIDQVCAEDAGGRIFALWPAALRPTPPPRLARHRLPASGRQDSVGLFYLPTPNTHPTNHTGLGGRALPSERRAPRGRRPGRPRRHDRPVSVEC